MLDISIKQKQYIQKLALVAKKCLILTYWLFHVKSHIELSQQSDSICPFLKALVIMNYFFIKLSTTGEHVNAYGHD